MSLLRGTVLLFLLCHDCCEGFDFTLHTQQAAPGGGSSDACGVLRCAETVSDGAANQSRSLTSLSISRRRVGPVDQAERWQQVATVSPQDPSLDRVSDALLVKGQFSGQSAELTVQLTKPHDCLESQFSCLVVSVDGQGRTSVTKSLVGKAVDSYPSPGIRQPPPPTRVSSEDQAAPAAGLVQLMSSLHARFDLISSRLDDSVKSLENRLEDKVADLRASFENRMNTMGDRVEDRLTQIHLVVAQNSGEFKSTSPETGNLFTQLVSKLNDLENNLRGVMDARMDEVSKQTKEVSENLSDQLSLVSESAKSIEKNLTYFDDTVSKLETAVDQCVVQAAAPESSSNANVADIVSSVTALSDVTLNLVSQVSSFIDTYAGGALVPMPEFSDPLGTGKKEWQLVFRGTAYNNVQVYPAYIHGTGIPVEVEVGCKQFGLSLPCVNHYRNGLVLNAWRGVDKVLFAVYRGGHIVQHVIFNGDGSTYTSWFSADRVISSSWEDLATQPHNYFSLEGFVPTTPGHIRRFHINRDYDGGCAGYKGWFSVKDVGGPACPVEKTVSVPMFQYATGKTFAEWNGPSVARADAIGVYLKYH